MTNHSANRACGGQCTGQVSAGRGGRGLGRKGEETSPSVALSRQGLAAQFHIFTPDISVRLASLVAVSPLLRVFAFDASFLRYPLKNIIPSRSCAKAFAVSPSARSHPRLVEAELLPDVDHHEHRAADHHHISLRPFSSASRHRRLRDGISAANAPPPRRRPHVDSFSRYGLMVSGDGRRDRFSG